MRFFSFENIFKLVQFFFFVIFSIKLFLLSRHIKQVKAFLSFVLSKIFMEDDVMKYRTENYQDKEPVKGQSFDTYLKTYRLNKVTNELEETEPIDIQEMVNSCLSTCLSEVLTRFFPDQLSNQNSTVALVEEMEDDLDYMQDTYNITQKYVDMFNLDPTLSMQEVFDIVNQKSKELSDKLQKSNEIKSNEIKSEVSANENAQKNEQESK